MFETDEEIERLQALLDRSHGKGGEHMGSIVTPERRLTAGQVVTYLQGVKHVAFATVTAKGEPFVSPLDSFFLHGRFTVGTVARAVKAGHVRRNPAVSLTHMRGDEIGIWAHGRAQIWHPGEPIADEYLRVAEATYGQGFEEPDIIVMTVEPRALFAYAFDPSKFPESAQ